MTREEIINTMIDTVNTFNASLMKEGGATDKQIADAVVQQRPSFEGMFNLIYDDLVAKGVFE
jgi:hypothetical protein